MKKSAPLRIDHCRHSGESRNPVPSGMAILRLFISSSLAGINQKIKKKQITWSTSRLPPACAGMTNKAAPPRKDRSRPVHGPPPSRRLTTYAKSRNQGFFNNPEERGIAFRCLPRRRSAITPSPVAIYPPPVRLRACALSSLTIPHSSIGLDPQGGSGSSSFISCR